MARSPRGSGEYATRLRNDCRGVQGVNREHHHACHRWSCCQEQKAEVLGVEAGSPSLSVSRFYQGRGGRMFEVSISEHPASNFSYTFEFTRGWQTADHWSWSN